MSLAHVYRRLAEACPVLGLTVGAPGPEDGPGWVNGSALAHDEAALRDWLEAGAARIEDGHGKRVRPDVVASRALHAYLWSACLLISGPWYLERRVPRLRPGHVWLGPGAGLRVAVPGSFSCLPGDPAAGRPGATVREGEEALRAQLRRTVADHAAPLLAALGARTRRGGRALWGMVGDDLVSGLWRLGAALGDEEHGAAMATLVLPAPQPPFPGGADFRWLPAAEAEAGRLTRTRTGCCLHYAIDPQGVCGTCPRLAARLSGGEAAFSGAAGPEKPAPAPWKPAHRGPAGRAGPRGAAGGRSAAAGHPPASRAARPGPS
ncbi:(2Fe-2S)-binding protein [Streptomyces sp. NPDC021020]|uniref:(2Fe-2S)-binding protein n=1 Tax=Streptomyces sp. NPDC021020 TaxID=3365109 RepID=UPI00379440F4